MAPLIPGKTKSDVPTENVTVARRADSSLEEINVGPLKMIILEDGRNTDNRLGITKAVVPAHTPGPAQHWHQMHDESFFVAKGTATFTSRDSVITAVEGDTVIIPPCAPHTFSNETDDVCELITTYTPAYYVNYFRLMAEMAEAKNGDPTRVDGPIARRAMLQYATIETDRAQDWTGEVNSGKDVAKFS